MYQLLGASGATLDDHEKTCTISIERFPISNGSLSSGSVIEASAHLSMQDIENYRLASFDPDTFHNMFDTSQDLGLGYFEIRDDHRHYF